MSAIRAPAARNRSAVHDAPDPALAERRRPKPPVRELRRDARIDHAIAQAVGLELPVTPGNERFRCLVEEAHDLLDEATDFRARQSADVDQMVKES